MPRPSGARLGWRVGLLFPNTPDFTVVWLAIARIGAVAVPISTLSTAAELRRVAHHADLHLIVAVGRYLNHDYVARLTEAFPGLETQRGALDLESAPFLRAIWLWSGQAPAWARAAGGAPSAAGGAPSAATMDGGAIASEAVLAAAEASVFPGDPVGIIYTSGSTSDPKGVIHSHGAFERQSRKLAASYPYVEDDRLFSPQPFFWVGGLIVHMLQALQIGMTIYSSEKSGAALLDYLEAHRITYFHAYAHACRALAKEPSFAARKLSMRGGRLHEAVPEERRFRNQEFGNALGMSETCGPHTIGTFGLSEDMRGANGPPMPGMQHRIVDVETRQDVAPGGTGELLLRGDCLMLGFVKREREDTFEPDGWYRSGDLCSMREGHIFFHGRVDDMIKSAGANVSPREVEDVLAALPGVAQAFVTGIPDKARGTAVSAIVVPRPGAELDVATLRAGAAQQLSSYKVPRVVVVMEAAELPMTSSTKIDRRAAAQILIKASEAN